MELVPCRLACVVLVVQQGKGARGSAKGVRPCADRASGVGKGASDWVRRHTCLAGSRVRETVWHSCAMCLHSCIHTTFQPDSLLV